MPLIKQGKIVSDPWTFVADDEDIPTATPVIVSLQRWKKEKELLADHIAPYGVWLSSADRPEDIADDVHRFDVVAIDFPTFKDGRPYSAARLLRDRYKYDGELRAVGNVLRDQLMFMMRCGFDAFDLEKPGDAAQWTDAIKEIAVFYQSAADGARSVPVLRQHGAVGSWTY